MSPPPRRRDLIILAAVVLAAHVGSLFNFFAYDDLEVIWAAFSDPAVSWTARPLRQWTIAADRWIWGADPFGYHLSNLLVHLAGVVGICALGRRLTSRPRAGLWAGLLYGTHPILCESVANIANRKELWLVLLAVLSILAFLRGGRWRWLSAAAFVLALLAKESAVAIPVLLLLCDAARRGAWRAVRWGDHIPFWGILAVGGWLFFLRGWGEDPEVRVVQIGLAGASWADLAAVAGEAFWRSVRLLAFPVGLASDHPLPSGGAAGMAALAAVALSVAVAAARAARAVQRAPLAFAWLWIAAAWLPVSNLASPAAFPVAERYWALPWAGLALGIAIAAERLARRLRSVPAVGVAFLLCAVTASARRDRDWRIDLPLSAACLRTNPLSWNARVSWGNVYGHRRGLDGPAQRAFAQAAQIEPRAAAVFYFWGRWDLAAGRADAAEGRFTRAHRLGYRSTQFFVDAVDAAVRRDAPEAVAAWRAAAAAAGRTGPLFAERLARARKRWDAEGIRNAAREAAERPQN